MSDPDQLVGDQPLWEATSDALVLVDRQGRIRATNSAFNTMFRHDDTLIGAPIESVVPLPIRSHHASLRNGFEAEPSDRPMAASRHLEGQRSDDSTFPVNVSLGRLQTREGELTFAAVRDLTDRVRAESEVATALRKKAMDDERERIAHDLHDTVIQRLFALGLGLQAVAPRIEIDDIALRIEGAVDAVDEIIEDLRSTIYGLRHRLSAGATARDQVFAVIDEMRVGLGFDPTVVMSGEFETLSDPGIIHHLLSVVREALSNTARHADATKATVTLSLVDGHLSLEVVDNGVGVKDNVLRSGLANLADRAIALDGSFEVRRHSPGGTLLRWQVPTSA